jgi:hypothetical protein
MKKIETLFIRDFDNDPRYVTETVNPKSQWVIDGEGVATRKYDGTCCAIINGIFVKRYEVKQGGEPPFGFIPANDVDVNTGKQQGWVEVVNGNEDRWHREAYEHLEDKSDGTFELLGPKIQGNPEKFETHILFRHSQAEQYLFAPRTYNELKEWFKDKEIEGLVWHHSDGRMAKLKKKDFPQP